MGDEGFDPCECMWGHEMAMRRLLNMLRNSQSDCTDAVCYTPQRDSPQEASNMVFMTICICMAMFMYYMAPRNARSAHSEPTKSRSNDSNGTPPTPPPAAT